MPPAEGVGCYEKSQPLRIHNLNSQSKSWVVFTVNYISRLLSQKVFLQSDDDELKRKQLMELAIINGTYRSGNVSQTAAAQAAAAAAANKNSLAALQARLIAPLPLAATQANFFLVLA